MKLPSLSSLSLTGTTLAIVVALLTLLAGIGGFRLGSTHWAKKYYSAQATLAKVTAEGHAAEREAKATEALWAGRVNQLETSLAEKLKASHEAELGSGSRIAGLVSDLTRCRIGELSQAAPDPSRAASAARIAQRAREIITALGSVGSAAQRDAYRYGAAQDLLEAERLNSPIK